MDNLSISYEFHSSFLKLETEGEMSYSDFILLINFVKKEIFLHKNNLKLLLDLRKTKASITEQELKKLVIPFMEMISKFNHVRMAELVETPTETALAILFNEDSKFIPNLDYNLFYKSESARKWLFKFI